MYDFLQKTTKINVFSCKFKKKPRTTQGPFENPRKNPRPSEKKPRTQDCFEKSKILGENPSSGNADYIGGALSVSKYVDKKCHNHLTSFVTTIQLLQADKNPGPKI